MSHEAICCSNLSRRRVVAICRIVCLGLKRPSARVSTSPDEFENTVITVRLTVTLICHANGALRKRWRHDNHVISLPEFSSNRNKMAGDWCVFKFLRGSVDGKHLIRFQSENAGSQFIRHGVDGGWEG